MTVPFVRTLAQSMVLGSLLTRLRHQFGGYDLAAHWQQGEFHHDIVLRIERHVPLPGPVLVVATNCNGGVKEVLSLAGVPTQGGLWRCRCPNNPEFKGVVPVILDRAVTEHWFDPCELLGPEARSELRSEFRQRQQGGGWQRKALA